MKHKTSIDGSPAQADTGLKSCGARKGTICPCRAGYHAWRRGNPFADLEPAPLWVPRGRNE
jgi:hypothetical protein